MRVSLVPDRLFETYEEITPEYLRQRGIRLLLSELGAPRLAGAL